MRKRIAYYKRLITAPIRRKPDFLIIGAQKSGTSSLFSLLRQHSQLDLPHRKEIHYFDWHYDKSEWWYKTWFPINRGLLTGEATPIYMFHPHVAQRVKKVLPKVKCVAILRNPVDRAYSHYNMVRFKGYETLSFEEAIAAEEDRMKQGMAELLQANYSLTLQRYSYTSRGYYEQQLKHWSKHLTPKSLHVLFYEDLISNPEGSIRSICGFLGLEAEQGLHLPHINAHKYAPMLENTRLELERKFAEPNRELAKWLGNELPW